MKIAIVCFNLGWQTGGPRLIFSMAQALKRLGHKIVIYAPDYNPDIYPDLSSGLEVRVVEAPLPFHWQYKSSGLFGRIFEKLEHERAVSELSKKMSEVIESDFDVLNCHDYAYRMLPFYKRKNPHVRVIWTMNEPPYMYLPKTNWLYDKLSRLFNAYKDLNERKYFRLVDRVVTFIDRNKKWIENRGPKAVIIWPGIEFEKFYAPVKKFGEPKKSLLLLGVGAFNKYRRYDNIIEAAAILRKNGYDARVLLICKDIWNAAQDKAELLELTKKLEMEPYVEFHFEGATEEGLREAYAKSDVYVAVTHLPLPRDGFSWGLAFFEAMAAGLPVILTNKNDAKEALEDGKSVLLVPPLNPESIAEKVKLVMNDPQPYYIIASAGQKIVKDQMSWDVYAKKMMELANG